MEVLELQIGARTAIVKTFIVDGAALMVNIHTGLIETSYDSAMPLRPVLRNMYINEINNCKLPTFETNNNL